MSRSRRSRHISPWVRCILFFNVGIPRPWCRRVMCLRRALGRRKWRHCQQRRRCGWRHSSQVLTCKVRGRCPCDSRGTLSRRWRRGYSVRPPERPHAASPSCDGAPAGALSGTSDAVPVAASAVSVVSSVPIPMSAVVLASDPMAGAAVVAVSGPTDMSAVVVAAVGLVEVSAVVAAAVCMPILTGAASCG